MRECKTCALERGGTGCHARQCGLAQARGAVPTARAAAHRGCRGCARWGRQPRGRFFQRLVARVLHIGWAGQTVGGRVDQSPSPSRWYERRPGARVVSVTERRPRVTPCCGARPTAPGTRTAGILLRPAQRASPRQRTRARARTFTLWRESPAHVRRCSPQPCFLAAAACARNHWRVATRSSRRSRGA